MDLPILQLETYRHFRNLKKHFKWKKARAKNCEALNVKMEKIQKNSSKVQNKGKKKPIQMFPLFFQNKMQIIWGFHSDFPIFFTKQLWKTT